MTSVRWILSVTVLLGGVAGCAYNPALPDQPFLCGPGAKCPDGYQCYGGICGKNLPACMDHNSAEFSSWPDDSDLEPNNTQDLALTLPCGENPLEDPTYGQRCPSRENYTNGYMNLTICPENDSDFYKIFLQENETVTFQVLYQFSQVPPRDVDARVWRADLINPNADYQEVTVGTSTNDNETLTVSTETSTGNPPGWYYLEVHGKTPTDVGVYTVSFTLNPTQTQ